MSQYRKLVQEISSLLENTDANEQENFCQLCSKLIIGEPESLRLFECSHMLCRGCLLEVFHTRIQDNENVNFFFHIFLIILYRLTNFNALIFFAIVEL